MKQQGFSLFPLHFQLEVEVLKDTHKTMGEIQTISPTPFGYLELMSAALSAVCFLISYAECDTYPGLLWELSSVISYLKLQVSVVWTKVTSSLSFV